MVVTVDSQAPAGLSCADSGTFPAVGSRKFHVTAPDGSKVTYEATLIRFSNAWQLFITYSGRIGSWICASADTPHSDVYSVRTLLGDRLREHLAVYARSIIKLLCDSLRTRQALELDRDVILILALDIKDDDTETFKQIMEAIADIFKL